MSEFNPEFAKRLLSQCDLDPKKKVRVPVYRELHKLLIDELDVIPSTAGQIFVYLPTGRYNYFTVPLHSNHIRGWLIEHHMSVGHPPPSNQQLREAMRAFEARPTAGSIAGARRQMNLRTAWNPFYHEPVPITNNYGTITSNDHFQAPAQPAIIFSLDTRRGRHVAITPEGWSLQSSHTEFVHDPIQQSLPDPEPAPTRDPEAVLASFRKLLRLDGPTLDATWKMLLAWILVAMRPPKNPAFHDYPILNLTGPANSGKTVTAKLLTQLLDPTGIPVHSIPTTERRLHQLAAAQHILAFDNPGKINPEKSRYLSRLSTGIGSMCRQLQGVLVRPIILTTRDLNETKHLATRVVDVDLPEQETLLPQLQILEEFEELRPQILAALFTLISRDFDAPTPHLPNRKTIQEKFEESIPSLIAGNQGTWKGTATDLQAALDLPLTNSCDHKSRKNNRTVTLTLTALAKAVSKSQKPETKPVGSGLLACEPGFCPVPGVWTFCRESQGALALVEQALSVPGAACAQSKPVAHVDLSTSGASRRSPSREQSHPACSGA